jgi:hypothetical protein
MSIQLWHSLKELRRQFDELLVRVESLEESRLETRKKRDILTLPSKDIPTLLKVGNGSSERGSINGPK